MGDGLTLVQTIFAVVAPVIGLFGTIIGVYLTHRLRKKREDRSSSQGNPTTNNNEDEESNMPAGNTPVRNDVPLETYLLAQTTEMRYSRRTPTSLETVEIRITKRYGMEEFVNQDHPFEHDGFDGIKIIKISCGEWIDSLEVQYTRDGNLIWTPLVGSQGGSVHEVVLEDDEYITAVQGYYGRHQEMGIITSLTFATNRNRHFGPYGEVMVKHSPHRSFEIKGMIVGFHGTAGRFISSIGFYWRPIHDESTSQLLPVETTPPLLVMVPPVDATKTTTHLPLIETMSSSTVLLPVDAAETTTHLSLIETMPLSTVLPPVDAAETTVHSSVFKKASASLVESLVGEEEREADLYLEETTESLSPKEMILTSPVVTSVDVKETKEPSSSMETTLPSVLADPKGKTTDLSLKEASQLHEAVGIFGPWGGWSIGSSPFDQYCDGQIRIITVRSGLVIDSIKVQYEMDGNLIWTPQAGGDGGDVENIELRKGEYIIEIEGEYRRFFEELIVSSLTFTSNMGRKFGPYGTSDKPPSEDWGKTTPFHLRGERIVGFHGHASKYINSIGFYVSPSLVELSLDAEGKEKYQSTVQTTSQEAVGKFGPWGDTSMGNPFSQYCNGQIRMITIHYNQLINSIKVQYERGGNLIWTPQAGGDGGDVENIELQKEEYIIEVKGSYIKYNGSTAVTSLAFITNKGSIYGPYGEKKYDSKQETSFLVTGGTIVGFHGTAASGSHDNYITSVGFYVSMIETTMSSLVLPSLDAKGKEKHQSMEETTPQLAQADSMGMTSKLKVAVSKLGPWGDTSIGHPFDQCCNGQIRTITIHSGRVLHSIKFQYEMNGNLIWTPQAGGKGGIAENIVLQKGEYIVEVKGEYMHYVGSTAVNSVTFITSNGNKFGPYGTSFIEDNRRNFQTPFHVRGMIVGFLGTSTKYITSIGFYVSTIETTSQLTQADSTGMASKLMEAVGKLGPWGGRSIRSSSFDQYCNGQIRIISIDSGPNVNSINVLYEMDGKFIWAPQAGGDGRYAENVNSIKVQYERGRNFIWDPQAGEYDVKTENIVLRKGEYIIEVRGEYRLRVWGEYQRTFATVNQLTFTTNNGNKFGPYGYVKGGTVGVLRKSIPFRVRGGTIVGFHGTRRISSRDFPSSNLSSIGDLSSIGFYVSPIETSSHFTQAGSSRMTSKFTEIIGEVGPWGNTDVGLSFDHNFNGEIKTILIGCGRVVESLEVLYEKDGKLIRTPQIGGKGGTIKEIHLEDGEYITKIKGYYEHYSSGSATINSLTFFTNRRNYLGPFGFDDGTEPPKEAGDIFRLYDSSDDETETPNEAKGNLIPFEVGGGKIVGFYGTAGSYLSSIGFYLSPIETTSSSLVEPPVIAKRKEKYQSMVEKVIAKRKEKDQSMVETTTETVEIKTRKDEKLISTPQIGGFGGTVKKV